MYHCLFNLFPLINSRILFVFLLIFCKSIPVHAIEDAGFDQFIKKVESLKDENPGEAYTYLNTQADSLATLSTENQLIYYKVLAEIYVEQGLYQKSKNVASKALQTARSLSSPSIIMAELLFARGFAIESLGDYKMAREDYLNGLEIADSLNDKKIVAVGLINIGALDYLMEKFDRALVMFNDALAIAQQLKDDELSGFIYSELGILYSLINQEEKSLAYYQQSYEYYLKAGKTYYAYNTLRNIAANHSINERYEQAIPFYKEVIDNAEQISNDELIAYAYSGMAWAQIKQKDSDPEASYQYMLIASQYAENAQQADFPIAHALDKGYLFMELERYEEALESMNKASDLLKNYKNSDKKVVTTISKINVLYLKAELYFKLENYQQAYQAQEELMTFSLSLPEKSNIEEVEDLRMKYESEQADLQKKILEQRESVQALLIAETQNNAENRQFLISMFAIIALVLAWLLVKTISGQRKLLTASRTDSLTGVVNRRYLMHKGSILFNQAQQTQQSFSILMIDVDDFKSINDNYGHQTGDMVLQTMTSLCQQIMRKDDIFGRFGGEEFIALLPESSNTDALEIAERVRVAIEQYDWSAIVNRSLSLSIGVASLTDESISFDQVLKKADDLLYVAKRQGKNTVCSDNECNNDN